MDLGLGGLGGLGLSRGERVWAGLRGCGVQGPQDCSCRVSGVVHRVLKLRVHRVQGIEVQCVDIDWSFKVPGPGYEFGGFTK